MVSVQDLQNVANNLNNNIIDVSNNLNNNIKDVGNNLDNNIKDVANNLQTNMNNYNEMTNEKINTVNEDVSSLETKVTSDISSLETKVTDKINKLIPALYKNSTWTQKGQDIVGEAEDDLSGWDISLSSDGNIVAIGAPFNDGNGINSGHVRVYKWNGSSWNQIGQDIDGEAADDNSGISVSLSSDGYTIAIGGGGMINENGDIRVYQYNKNSNLWIKLGEDINIKGVMSVSLSSDGRIVACGTSNFINEPIRVRVYQYNNNNNSWIQLGEDIIGETTNFYSKEKMSLSSDGSTIAIGSYLNDNSGHVSIYKYKNSNSWTKIGDINGKNVSDKSGHISLNSDGNIVAIGAYKNDDNGSNSGHVRVYQYNNNSWTQMGQNIVGEEENDEFGYSVSLSSDGNIVAIGSYISDNNGVDSGHVIVYKYISNKWTQIGQIINGTEGDESGLPSLSSDGSIIAIGAYLNDGNGTNSGHVRVYKNDTVSLLSSIS